MRGVLAIWHGSLAETNDLLDALDHNCDCKRNAAGQRLELCSAHRILADQRELDGLLYARWLASRLEVEEWEP